MAGGYPALALFGAAWAGRRPRRNLGRARQLPGLAARNTGKQVIGTVALAVLTFITLLFTVITTRQERLAAETRMKDERAYATEGRRRERRVDRISMLIARVAEIQPAIATVSGALTTHSAQEATLRRSTHSGTEPGQTRQCSARATQPRKPPTATARSCDSSTNFPMHVLPAIATATWTYCETMSDGCWSVPPGDLRPLKEQVRRFEVVEYDDVHRALRCMSPKPACGRLSELWRLVSWRSARA